MKRKILKALMSNIKKNKPDLNEEQLEIIEYGLDCICIMILKIIIILLLAYFLNILKETIYIIIFYNVTRFFAFGMHAKNGTLCLLISTTIFIGGAYLATYLQLTLSIKIIISIACLILICIYAPSDTEKRPLINSKKRKKLKTLSIITSIIMGVLIICLHNNYISNFMVVGQAEAVIMILPITYKLFGLPYNNYKNYIEK